MRVGIVVLSVKTGGSERRLAKLVQYLAGRGRHSYYLLAPEHLLRSLRDEGTLPSEGLELRSMGPDPGGEHLERLAATHYTAFLAWRRLLTAALAEAEVVGPTDVVHFLNPVSYFMAPLPFRRHAVVEAVGSGEGWHVELMLRQAAERGAAVNCLSRSIQHSLARGMGPDMVRRLHVSPGSMVGVPDAPAVTKQRRVVFLGRLDRVKNPLLFAAAIGLVAKKRRDFRVSISADGSLRGAVDSLFRASGVADLVDWNEDQPPGPSFAQSLVAVTLQAVDNYPRQSLLEAMTCRTAIVASDVGLTHRLVSPDTGLLVPLEAPAVAAAVESLLADPERATRMGEAARALVRREHRVDRYADYVEQLYGLVA